jgi:hypothetical protein
MGELRGAARARWELRAERLDAPLVRAIVQEERQRRRCVLQWIEAADHGEFDEDYELVADWVLRSRQRLLGELAARFISLRERESQQRADVLKAARIFDEEFCQLMQREQL